jgi:hypothetical protein
MNKSITALVASTLVAAALVLAPSTANAQLTGSMQLAFADRGHHLIGRGAFATLTAEVVCTFPGNFEFSDGQAFLRQAQGRELVDGGGDLTVSSADCDGTPHSVNVTVAPQNAPFRPGLAVVIGTVRVCFSDPATGEFGCASDTDGPKEIFLSP